MLPEGTPITILVADADADDRLLLEEMFIEHNLHNPLHFVDDGEQLMAYLKREGDYQDLDSQPLPGVLLLNLKLPKLNGSVALKEISCDPELAKIPVSILTTSQTQQDILIAHDIGASSFVNKPVTLAGLFKAISTTADCWIKVVAPLEDQNTHAA